MINVRSKSGEENYHRSKGSREETSRIGQEVHPLLSLLPIVLVFNRVSSFQKSVIDRNSKILSEL